MTGTADERGNHLFARYRHGDAARRAEFDRALGRYLRGRHDRWDVTPLLEALDRLGEDIGDVSLTLRPAPAGRLRVTIACELAPDRPPPDATRKR
ncbi:hypothetical protein TR51_10355 [Kitasatospora griseola]|uniref:Uncharacterized protein n=1 Tax=Kitasatospora griseola TaxID=2064 RepID=A0A0D0Q104_KITGR|nr:hypothetical protein [Kitasatospora griseola]KIQ64628.1 hypothetical protein TR51_10355 [Kitasatospora griseola]